MGSQSLGPLPQLAIRRDQRDHLINGIQNDLNEQVVSAAGSVKYRHAVGDASLGALASLAFQNYDDRLGDPSRVNGRPHLVDERSSGSRSVPPPAGRARTDYICCINQKHCSSLIVSANGRETGGPSEPTLPGFRAHSQLWF